MSRLSPPLRRSERHFALIRVATALVLLLLASPLAAVGQVPERIARIGMLRSETRPLDDRIKRNIADVRAGLQDAIAHVAIEAARKATKTIPIVARDPAIAPAPRGSDH